MSSERESDWGVPLPGEIVPVEQRSQTQLKRLPLGSLDAVALFGRQAPLVVDLGCGNGRATILSALHRPQCNHLAVDVFSGAIRHAVRRANRRGLQHVRFAVADAQDVVSRLVPEQSVTELCLYHPQPIYDLALAHKRLVTPAFLLHAHRVLVPGGLFIIQTDHPAYWEYLRQVLPFFFDVTEQHTPWPDAPEGRTRREILARQMNLPIFRAIAVPRMELDRVAARQWAESQPLPRFDADRRLLHLEEREGIDG